jgi:hypothetical protein
MAETLASQLSATAGDLSTVRSDVDLERLSLVRLVDGDKHPVGS